MNTSTAGSKGETTGSDFFEVGSNGETTDSDIFKPILDILPSFAFAFDLCVDKKIKWPPSLYS